MDWETISSTSLRLSTRAHLAFSNLRRTESPVIACIISKVIVRYFKNVFQIKLNNLANQHKKKSMRCYCKLDKTYMLKGKIIK